MCKKLKKSEYIKNIHELSAKLEELILKNNELETKVALYKSQVELLEKILCTQITNPYPYTNPYQCPQTYKPYEFYCENKGTSTGTEFSTCDSNINSTDIK